MATNKIHHAKADTIFNALNYTLMGIILLIVLYPLWFILIASIFFAPPVFTSAQRVPRFLRR